MVTVLAPHTDDAELGCGGTIARLLESGCNVSVVAFSIARDSVPPEFPENILESEFRSAMDVLGVPETNRRVLDFQVRTFPENRQAILDQMIQLRSEWQPDLVLLPSSSDVHQDHEVICREGLRAFKHVGVWGYEMPWNQATFSAGAHVTLDERHIRRKWQALLSYKSQIAKSADYFSQQFIESMARVRGVQVRSEFAEAFEVIRTRL